MPYVSYESDWIDWGTYPVFGGAIGGNIGFKGQGVGTVYTTPPNYAYTQNEINGAFSAADAVLMGGSPVWSGSGGSNSVDWTDAQQFLFFQGSSSLTVNAAAHLWGVSAWQLYSLAPQWGDYYPLLKPKIGIYGYYNPGPNNAPTWLDYWGNPYPEPFTRAWPTMVSPETGDTLQAEGYTFADEFSTIVSASLRTFRYATTDTVRYPQGEEANPLYSGSRTATFRIGNDLAQPWTTPSNTYGHYLYDNSTGNPGWLPSHSTGWTTLDSVSLAENPTTPSYEVVDGYFITNGGPFDITSYVLAGTPYYGTTMLTNLYTGSMNRITSHSRAVNINVGHTPMYVDWVMNYPLVKFTYSEYIEPPVPPTVLPPLRQFPRDDRLGGTGRLFPRPQSQQGGTLEWTWF